MEPNNKKYILTAAYIAASDMLLLLLLSSFAMLVAEGMIPTFVSARLPLAYVGIALLFLIALIQWLGSTIGIDYEITKKKHLVLFPLLLTLTFLFVSNSMLKYPFWQNLLITLGLLSVFYILFTLLFFPTKHKK